MESRSAAQHQARQAARDGGRDEDGLVVVDAERRVRLVDHRARELLGGLLAIGEEAPAFLLAAAVVTLQEPEVEGVDAIELRVRATRVDGAPGWTVIVADVSRRRSPAEEARELVSTVCHEMRTPLTAIVGYADALREAGDELTPERRAAHVAVILRQGERLARLVTDLADLARPGRGLDVRPEVVDVDAVIDDVLAALREDAEGVEVTGDRQLRVRVDRGHLEHILTNLVTNARKYGRPPITIDLERQDFQGVVRVRDAGAGVPEGFVHRMWDRFSRARVDERPPEASGTGLGLAVVAGLTDANAGHAWYERNEPTGACFCVAVPLAGSPLAGGPDADAAEDADASR